MPLPETMGPENEVDPRHLKAMGLTLITCIKQAFRRGHLTCGMTACAELLQRDPETIMFCLLPADATDVAANIHQMLIEAFCHENLIPILKTGDQQKVAALVNKLTSGNTEHAVKGDAKDTTCLLLQCCKLGPSKQEETLTHFYNDMMANPHPMPYLTLPD
ncbi:growth arrest and DNA damage-inducible protein gadd45 gamma-like [Plakobranchus ocellatus]|uniref:Growth arrest and DNA damage-inducible protein gadd45 gamma-like n=1 Tax=Plakobranchus ocellatus TaxID=259542 RepID=A0AAV4ARP3_9GAST|nr:growth arrest and DNA damage-inducible protein gadd45 gamma-like [Plakobranchus ocellatus]